MITTKKVSIEDMYLDVTGVDMRPVTILGDYRANGASGVIDAGCLSDSGYPSCQCAYGLLD